MAIPRIVFDPTIGGYRDLTTGRFFKNLSEAEGELGPSARFEDNVSARFVSVGDTLSFNGGILGEVAGIIQQPSGEWTITYVDGSSDTLDPNDTFRIERPTDEPGYNVDGSYEDRAYSIQHQLTSASTLAQAAETETDPELLRMIAAHPAATTDTLDAIASLATSGAGGATLLKAVLDHPNVSDTTIGRIEDLAAGRSAKAAARVKDGARFVVDGIKQAHSTADQNFDTVLAGNPVDVKAETEALLENQRTVNTARGRTLGRLRDQYTDTAPDWADTEDSPLRQEFAASHPLASTETLWAALNPANSTAVIAAAAANPAATNDMLFQASHQKEAVVLAAVLDNPNTPYDTIMRLWTESDAAANRVIRDLESRREEAKHPIRTRLLRALLPARYQGKAAVATAVNSTDEELIKVHDRATRRASDRFDRMYATTAPPHFTDAPEWVHQRVAANPLTTIDTLRSMAAESPSVATMEQIARHPNATPDVLTQADYASITATVAVIAHPNVTPDLLETIARREESEARRARSTAQSMPMFGKAGEFEARESSSLALMKAARNRLEQLDQAAGQRFGQPTRRREATSAAA